MKKIALLVGSRDDVHLATVLDRLTSKGVAGIVVNAESISSQGFSITPDEIRIGGHDIPAGTSCWIRRLATTRWTTGTTVGSIDDITFRTRVRLLASIARTPNRRWLTSIDALQAAEDRLFQLATARNLGICTPKTIVTSEPSEARQQLGDDVILKPLGTGAFVNREGEPTVVHTTRLDDAIEQSGDFADVPFVAQQMITTHQHLRIVTAHGVATTGSLDAADWPLDWREAEEAHGAWTPASHPKIEAQARQLADSLHLGYSSQDWLLNPAGEAFFIDLNPAGQWLFLPPAVADPITHHLVDFLSGVA